MQSNQACVAPFCRRGLLPADRPSAVANFPRSKTLENQTCGCSFFTVQQPTPPRTAGVAPNTHQCLPACSTTARFGSSPRQFQLAPPRPFFACSRTRRSHEQCCRSPFLPACMVSPCRSRCDGRRRHRPARLRHHVEQRSFWEL